MALRGLSASPGPWQTRVRNPPHPLPHIPSLSQHPDRQHIARLFFAGGGVVALVGVLVFGMLPLALQPGMRAALAGACLLLGALFVLLLWRVAALPLAGAVRTAAWAASALTGLVALGLGSGVHSQVLGCWPLLITVTAVLAGAGSASLLTAACAAMAVGLALNEGTQWLPTAGAAGAEGLLLPLATISLMLGASLVVGILISRVVHRSLRQASEREQRFGELLGMSVDWYWELDPQLRFVQVEASPGMNTGITPDDHLGLSPWDISDFGLDDDEMDAHRADLEAHEPFSRLLLRRIDAQGRPRFFSASGKPRFDAGGAFRGYWGVGRDITAEVRAQHAVQASETRYRELFDRSPTPLVLHRGGRVLDANFAAATMCGVDSPEAMVGFDLLTLYRDEASRASAIARLRQLERLAIGEGLPVADFVLHSPAGRLLAVQATAVRVMAEDGPATLSIYFDVTARRATEAALRRSEALLSHLFATSPGCITLTEMASGRYVMVNPGFTTHHGLCGRRGDRAHVARARHLARPVRSRAPGGRRRRARQRERRDAGDRHQVGGTGVAAAVGGALRDGRQGLPGDQRARHHRDRARASRIRGDPAERARRHRLRARRAVPAGQPELGAHVRLRRRASSPARRSTRSGPTRRATPMCAPARAGPGRARAAPCRWRSSAKCAASTAACSGAACSARPSMPTHPIRRRDAVDRRGHHRAAPHGPGARPRARPGRGARAGPRAPSWPTPATRSARR